MGKTLGNLDSGGLSGQQPDVVRTESITKANAVIYSTNFYSGSIV